MQGASSSGMQEKDEFVDNIVRDLHALGFRHDALSHTSDHFQPMLECARKLIRSQALYADDTPVEQMREVCSRCPLSLFLALLSNLLSLPLRMCA